jgi:hypothetical protein
MSKTTSEERIAENEMLEFYVTHKYQRGVVYVYEDKVTHTPTQFKKQQQGLPLVANDVWNEYTFHYYDLPEGEERRGLISRLSERIEKNSSYCSAVFVDGKAHKWHFRDEISFK